jgi:hypothetical protein
MKTFSKVLAITYDLSPGSFSARQARSTCHNTSVENHIKPLLAVVLNRAAMGVELEIPRLMILKSSGVAEKHRGFFYYGKNATTKD